MKKLFILLFLLTLSITPVLASNTLQQKVEESYNNTLTPKANFLNTIFLIKEDYSNYETYREDSEDLYQILFKEKRRYCVVDSNSEPCKYLETIYSKYMLIVNTPLEDILSKEEIYKQLTKSKIIIEDKYTKELRIEILYLVAMLNSF